MEQASCYNELEIALNKKYHDVFSDFLLTLGIEAVEELADSLIVRSSESLDLVLWGVEEFATELGKTLHQKIDISTQMTQKSNEDWIQSYKKSIQPVEVGGFYVHPSWHKPQEEKINLLVDPALAFGSGHHESTSGSLLMLEKYVKKDDTLLDVGCGSGILSIAGLKLGAKVECCDTDEQAVLSTKSNMELNGVTCKRIWEGSASGANEKYDVIVANIIVDILSIISSDLISALRKGGILILSGIVETQEDRIYETYKSLKCLEVYKNNGWCTIVYVKE